MRVLLSIYLLGLSIFAQSQTKLVTDDGSVPRDSVFIELRAIFHPLPKDARVTLRFDGTNWSVTKCENTFKKDAKDIDITPKNVNLVDVYNRLIANDILALPNQYEIAGIKDIVDDGIGYTLSFKVGTANGRYIFDNPDEYVKSYSTIETFRKYKNIADIFFKELYKE